MDFERLLTIFVMIVVVFSALVIMAIFVELLLEFLKLRHQKEGNTTYVIVDKNQTVNNTIVNNEVNNEEVVEGNNGVEIETQEEHKPVLTLPEKRLIVAKGANKVYIKPFPPLYDGVPRKANVKVSIGNTVEENITVNLKVNGETTKSVSTTHKKIEVKH